MNGRQFRGLSSAVFMILVVPILGPQASAWAQSDDGWSFIVTPQVWISHIAKNGFAAPPDSGQVGGLFAVDPADRTIYQNPFPSESSPESSVNPQWGIQVAAQKGRWTLAAAFQYVNFDTINDITYTGATPFGAPPFGVVSQGERWAKEDVNTTRMDVDFALSYFFPGVLEDRLDVSAGAGFKFIYASASRKYFDLNDFASFLNSSPLLPPPSGLYTICFNISCTDSTHRQRVEQKSYLYAATFPMSASVHLTNDGKWLLPFSVTPLIGAEVRNDENVAYSINLPSTAAPPGQLTEVSVNRLDGTKFAYGVTADATLRWLINETFSAYAGMRVQYIKGHDTYLAYGPLVGMSVRFGVK